MYVVSMSDSVDTSVCTYILREDIITMMDINTITWGCSYRRAKPHIIGFSSFCLSKLGRCWLLHLVFFVASHATPDMGFSTCSILCMYIRTWHVVVANLFKFRYASNHTHEDTYCIKLRISVKLSIGAQSQSQV